MMMRAIGARCPSEVLEMALRLGVRILEFGNSQVQEAVLIIFREGSDESMLFEVICEAQQTAIDAIKKRRKFQKQSQAGKSADSKEPRSSRASSASNG